MGEKTQGKCTKEGDVLMSSQVYTQKNTTNEIDIKALLYIKASGLYQYHQ